MFDSGYLSVTVSRIPTRLYLLRDLLLPSFGPFWGQLEPSWGPLGPSWGRLGAVLGHLGAMAGHLENEAIKPPASVKVAGPIFANGPRKTFVVKVSRACRRPISPLSVRGGLQGEGRGLGEGI